MINTDSNTVIKYHKSISTPINEGRSLLSGFTSSHKKLTLISGVATFGGSLLSELYGKLIFQAFFL